MKCLIRCDYPHSISYIILNNSSFTNTFHNVEIGVTYVNNRLGCHRNRFEKLPQGFVYRFKKIVQYLSLYNCPVTIYENNSLPFK